MSLPLDVVAGWSLPNGVVDSVEPFAVSRHLALAAEQRLTGVVHAAMLAGDLEVDDPVAVGDAHRASMARSLALEDVLLEAVSVLEHATIEFRLLKGAALAHMDATPEQREFGDNDLLVRPDQLVEAAAAFEAVGASRVQPPLSPTWERRFAKSVTLRWRDTELDLHRTLAPGPYGHTIDAASLFAGSNDSAIRLAGISVPTLTPEAHLVHAAVHVALGDVVPRLGNVRDTALLIGRPGLDADRVIATVVAWRVEAPFAAGVLAAADIGAEPNGIVEWARRARRTRADRRAMASYAERDGRFRRQALASLRVLPWRDRVAYLRSLRSR